MDRANRCAAAFAQDVDGLASVGRIEDPRHGLTDFTRDLGLSRAGISKQEKKLIRIAINEPVSDSGEGIVLLR